MVVRDNAEAIRNRAYEIWEREGRPNGREHEHWAEAAREIEEAQRLLDQEESRPREVVQPWVSNVGATKEKEAERLRKALWEPQPHSVELFPGDGHGAERLGARVLPTRIIGGRDAA
ncbi:DUF2934 domain-containing protein [Consotaella salsifontis]|uniref:DUF2934 domain-containing protein n=1 Tax=Consotaella salsifontis TaxID=1365950 RepID=A0A1T4T777_9HYPH|nr:DUF2934 domain-containing protein [Consotaella salsifontis]SKA36350.1 Protein of unknown function [Consotaella salsifontis]